MKRLNVHLTENELSALDEVSRRTGYVRAELIRKAVDLFLRNWYEIPGLTGVVGVDNVSIDNIASCLEKGTQ